MQIAASRAAALLLLAIGHCGTGRLLDLVHGVSALHALQRKRAGLVARRAARRCPSANPSAGLARPSLAAAPDRRATRLIGSIRRRAQDAARAPEPARPSLPTSTRHRRFYVCLGMSPDLDSAAAGRRRQTPSPSVIDCGERGCSPVVRDVVTERWSPVGRARPENDESPAVRGFSLVRRRGLEPPPGYPGPGPQPGASTNSAIGARATASIAP